MSEVNYIPLAGRGMKSQVFGVTATRCRLALGPDHLLAVETVGYTENYKRFFYRDIQAITVRHTQGWLWMTVLLGIPLLLVAWGLVSLLTSDSDDEAKIGMGIFLGILGLLFAVPLLINLFRGPTCQTRIHTAVQTEELASLKRRRVALRVLATLQPLIESAQGNFAPGELATRLAGGPDAVTAAPAPVAVLPPAPPPRVPYTSRAHIVMSWLAVADLVGTPAAFAVSEGFATGYSLLHILALAAASIVALVKQSNTTLPKWLRRLPVFLLTQLVLFFVASIAVGIVYAVTNPALVRNGQFRILEDPVSLAMTICSTLASGGLGLWGLLLWRQFKQGAPATEPPPATPPAP